MCCCDFAFGGWGTRAEDVKAVIGAIFMQPASQRDVFVLVFVFVFGFVRLLLLLLLLLLLVVVVVVVVRVVVVLAVRYTLRGARGALTHRNKLSTHGCCH